MVEDKNQDKGRGKAVHEIILDTERGGTQSQVSRILDEQTEAMVKQLDKSRMEQLLLESERKTKEEELRLRQVEEGGKPLPSSEPERVSEAKNILDAVKIGVEVAKPQQQQQGSLSDITKSMAEMFKTGVEIGRGAQPQQPQQNTFEVMKQYHEMFLKPVLDQLSNKDKEMMEMRMRGIENKITERVSPQDYIKEVQETAKNLGLGGGGKSDVDLKLEEMRETHDIEMAKLGFETRKWEHSKESDGKTLDQIKDIVKIVTDGPVGKAIENLGSGAADKLRRGKNNNTPLVKVQCPNCHGEFSVNPALRVVSCIHCGTTLQAAQEPPPQTETQAQSSPATEAVAPQEVSTAQPTQQETQTSDHPANQSSAQ